MLEFGTDALTRSQEAAEEQARILAEEERLLREEFDRLVASVSSATDMFFGFALQEDAVSSAQRRLFDALAESSGGLEGSGEAAENARAAAARFADEFDDLIGQLVEDQRPVSEIADTFRTLRDNFLSTAEQAGFTTDEIGMLTAALDAIPATVSTQLEIAVAAGDRPHNSIEAVRALAAIPPEVAAFLASLPQLADGGVVRRPTLALIGESGPEAVVPLPQMGSGGGMGSVTNVTVNVEGSVLAESDLVDIVQSELIRGQRRNATLEFR